MDLAPQLPVPLPYKDSDLYQLPQSLLRRLYDSHSVSLEGLLKVLSKASTGRRRPWRDKGQGTMSYRLDWPGEPLQRRGRWGAVLVSW